MTRTNTPMIGEVHVRDLAFDVKLKVKGLPLFRLRWAVATWVFYLAAFIAGSEINIEIE